MSRVVQVLEKLGVPHRVRDGRAWLERCPLASHGRHNEAHAYQNFFVRVAGGPWAGFHCFSCKGQGVLVDLVMLARGVAPARVAEIQGAAAEHGSKEAARDYREFVEALRWVREVAGADAEKPVLTVRAVVARPRDQLALPVGVEMLGQPLARWNSVPRRYAEERGIADWQVSRWGIGYALEGRLEGRVFMPIRDREGRLRNYAARSFAGHEKRYLAAASWEGPDKSALFGEEYWPPPDARRERVAVLFEGALNGLAVERALRDGPPGAWGACLAGMSGLDEGAGGVIDVRTLTKLATFPRVLAATDPDGPGDRVAAGVERALRRRCEVRRLQLPAGKDACDVERQLGRWRLAQLLGDALRAAWA